MWEFSLSRRMCRQRRLNVFCHRQIDHIIDVKTNCTQIGQMVTMSRDGWRKCGIDEAYTKGRMEWSRRIRNISNGVRSLYAVAVAKLNTMESEAEFFLFAANATISSASSKVASSTIAKMNLCKVNRIGNRETKRIWRIRQRTMCDIRAAESTHTHTSIRRRRRCRWQQPETISNTGNNIRENKDKLSRIKTAVYCVIKFYSQFNNGDAFHCRWPIVCW